MTRREAFAGVVGAVTGGTVVLAAVYACGPWSSSGRVVAASGQGASAGADGARGTAFDGSADDPWRAANASLVDQERECRHRLAASETELKKATKKLTLLVPDAGPLRDPFNPTTQEEWKYLAKFGVMRAKNFCFPKADWQPSDDDLSELGLAPSDGPAFTKAIAATAQRLWQTIQPACAKIVGVEEANRLGDDGCFTLVLHSFPESQWNADAQLVSNIRAGNIPMPPPDQLDVLATRMLAMTSAASDLEKDLAESFGPELAHEIAIGRMPWGPCTVQLGNKLPLPPDDAR